MKGASMSGINRVPFYFGSLASTGVEAIPTALAMTDQLTKHDVAANLKVNAAQIHSLRKMIRLMINPQTLHITPYVRISEVKTGGGRTYYHWLDEGGRSAEAYILTMNGLTGNLLPNNPDAALKLYFYMRLRELTLEPFWVYDPKTKTKVRNYAFIIVRTVGLPVSIIFQGFFRKPIIITEDANNQYNIAWDFEFVIENMKPDLFELSKNVGATMLVPGVVKNLLGI